METVHHRHTQPENHSQFQPLDLTIRARCPNCQKLYSVESSLISVDKPEFECVTCQAHFWFSYPLPQGEWYAETYLVNASAGIDAGGLGPVQETACAVAESYAAPEMMSCPRCSRDNPVNAEECSACGIIIKKFLAQKEEERVAGEIMFTGSPELVALWDDVLENYEDESVHERFVNECWAKNCLPFASQKYGRVLASSPEEEIAKKMRKRLIAMASHKCDSKVKKPAARLRLPGINSMVIVLGAAVMMTGFLIPGLRNMVGIGVSMIALAIGLRFYLGRPI